jgi:hypothetical protein
MPTELQGPHWIETAGIPVAGNRDVRVSIIVLIPPYIELPEGCSNAAIELNAIRFWRLECINKLFVIQWIPDTFGANIFRNVSRDTFLWLESCKIPPA